MDLVLEGGFHGDFLVLADYGAGVAGLAGGDETDTDINLAASWKTAGYKHKKDIAMIMIHKVVISENGSARVLWNTWKPPGRRRPGGLLSC